MKGNPPIEDEFTLLPISPTLKAYRRRVRDGKCVTCGKSRRGSPTLRCYPCTKRRNEKRRESRRYREKLRRKKIAALPLEVHA